MPSRETQAAPAAPAAATSLPRSLPFARLGVKLYNLVMSRLSVDFFKNAVPGTGLPRCSVQLYYVYVHSEQ